MHSTVQVTQSNQVTQVIRECVHMHNLVTVNQCTHGAGMSVCVCVEAD